MIRKVHKKVAAMEKEVCGGRFPEVLVDGQRCMATDGVMAVLLEHLEGYPEANEPTIQTTYVLDGEVVKSIKDDAAKGKKDDIGYSLVVLDGRPQASHTITKLVGTITKHQKGEPKEFCFDLDRLIQLSKVLYAGESASKRKVVMVRVYDDDEAPIEVETKIASARAVAYLAPCRK